jgi:hypothetical protein
VNSTTGSITVEESGSFYNYLSKGCRLCRRGAKMVLFVTGLCTRSCFYCPLSEERRGDVVFANERAVRCDDDVLCEAESMNALGTGITGGEPLLKLKQTTHYIKLLKKYFGDEHHIHLYTSLPASTETLQTLKNCGLDEIRFHPPQKLWNTIQNTHYTQSLRKALALNMEAGIEIPAIKPLHQIIKMINDEGGFLNLNELEFSETNAEKLHQQGYRICDDSTCAAEGSREIAIEASHTCNRIHFCPSTFKDSVQLRRRLLRTAKKIARPFEEITSDGTLIYGIIHGNTTQTIKILKEAGIPPEEYNITVEEKIETHWQILEKLKKQLKQLNCTLEVIEKYPTSDGLIVEKITL